MSGSAALVTCDHAPVTHGTVNRTHCANGVVLTETTHPPGTALPLHSHAHPAVTLVLRGGFTETFEGDAVHQCGERSLLFKLAGAAHTNGYAKSGTHSFIIEYTGLRLQRGCSVRVWGLTSWGRGPRSGGARAEGV